jgi:hypothetical protein
MQFTTTHTPLKWLFKNKYNKNSFGFTKTKPYRNRYQSRTKTQRNSFVRRKKTGTTQCLTVFWTATSRWINPRFSEELNLRTHLHVPFASWLWNACASINEYPENLNRPKPLCSWFKTTWITPWHNIRMNW